MRKLYDNKLCVRPPQNALCDLDLWSSDLGVWVACDVGYLCANFSLPSPLCSRLRPDVRDRQTDVRQTDVRQHHRLMPPPIRGGGIIIMYMSRRKRHNVLKHLHHRLIYRRGDIYLRGTGSKGDRLLNGRRLTQAPFRTALASLVPTNSDGH